jgi:hypothetical protein
MIKHPWPHCLRRMVRTAISAAAPSASPSANPRNGVRGEGGGGGGTAASTCTGTHRTGGQSGSQPVVTDRCGGVDPCCRRRLSVYVGVCRLTGSSACATLWSRQRTLRLWRLVCRPRLLASESRMMDPEVKASDTIWLEMFGCTVPCRPGRQRSSSSAAAAGS